MENFTTFFISSQSPSLVQVVLDALSYLVNKSFIVEVGLLLIGMWVYTWRTKTSIYHDILNSRIGEQISRISSTNNSAADISLEIIKQCEHKLQNSQSVVTNQEIDDCIHSLKFLYDTSHGASEPVQTGAFLGYRTCLNFSNMKSTNKPQGAHHPTSQVLYGYLLYSAEYIHRYASTSIEIPTRINTEYEYSVRPEFRRYIKAKPVRQIPGLRQNIDLHPLSAFVVIFYDSVLRPFQPPAVGGAHRKFFAILNDNIMMMIIMKIKKIYVPLQLEAGRMRFFNTPRILSLVHIQEVTRLDEIGNRVVYEVFYSNLDTVFAFVQNYNTTQKIKDLISENHKLFGISPNNDILQASYVNDETLKIIFEGKPLRRAYPKALYYIEGQIGKSLGYGLIKRLLNQIRARLTGGIMSLRAKT